MLIRKLFWNLGGKLPVWLVHPGQIILLIERWLGQTLFKGATLPAWWTANIVPDAIVAVGTVTALAVAVAGTFFSIEMGKSEATQMWMCIAKFCGGLIIAAIVLIMSGRLSTIWPWRHLRVAVVEIARHHCVCLVHKEPCTFADYEGRDVPARYTHWFWGPTLGSRNWKFRACVHGDDGMPDSSILTVIDERGGVYEFPITCQMMDSPDSPSYIMRRRMLYCVMREKGGDWTAILHRLFFDEMIEAKNLRNTYEAVCRNRELAYIEKGAWSDLVGRLLACYLEDGRTTRADREIALRLRRMEHEIVRPYMQYVAQHPFGLSADPAKLGALFDAMNWPPLVSARKKRAG